MPTISESIRKYFGPRISGLRSTSRSVAGKTVRLTPLGFVEDGGRAVIGGTERCAALLCGRLGEVAEGTFCDFSRLTDSEVRDRFRLAIRLGQISPVKNLLQLRTEGVYAIADSGLPKSGKLEGLVEDIVHARWYMKGMVGTMFAFLIGSAGFFYHLSQKDVSEFHKVTWFPFFNEFGVPFLSGGAVVVGGLLYCYCFQTGTLQERIKVGLVRARYFAQDSMKKIAAAYGQISGKPCLSPEFAAHYRALQKQIEQQCRLISQMRLSIINLPLKLSPEFLAALSDLVENFNALSQSLNEQMLPALNAVRGALRLDPELVQSRSRELDELDNKTRSAYRAAEQLDATVHLLKKTVAELLAD